MPIQVSKLYERSSPKMKLFEKKFYVEIKSDCPEAIFDTMKECKRVASFMFNELHCDRSEDNIGCLTLHFKKTFKGVRAMKSFEIAQSRLDEFAAHLSKHLEKMEFYYHAKSELITFGKKMVKDIQAVCQEEIGPVMRYAVRRCREHMHEYAMQHSLVSDEVLDSRMKSALLFLASNPLIGPCGEGTVERMESVNLEPDTAIINMLAMSIALQKQEESEAREQQTLQAQENEAVS